MSQTQQKDKKTQESRSSLNEFNTKAALATSNAKPHRNSLRSYLMGKKNKTASAKSFVPFFLL